MEAGLDGWVDIVVLILYFGFVLAIGLWTVCRPNRSSVKSYFLAGRDIGWWPVGASLYASNIGSEHFIGLAGTGAASGIAVITYEWMSMPLVLLLAWLFLPVYLAADVYTLPEYLEKRFSSHRLRLYLSCLSLLLYIVTKIAVCIYAGALFIQLSLGWNMYLSIAALLAITAVYTILGGLAAVIYTDALQTIIMTVGALALTIISFQRVSGYENLKYQYMRAVPSVRLTNQSGRCGFPRDDSFHIFRDPINSDLPWPGVLLQATVGCLWYWCADQVIVQRALAAKNISHAKGGAILAGYLKLLPLFLMVFPGMISRTLYPDEVGCIDPDECRRVCGNPVGCSNIAYPKLVMTLLPSGLRGLLLAVMMSAIMSSLTSIFNSASTLFTMDIWQRIRSSRASQRELLIVGRVAVLMLCGVSILWIPLLQSSAGGQLFVYIQSIQGYLGTPIGALFLLAVFYKRLNEKGAFYGILVGHLCGIVRMILDFVYPSPTCGEHDTRPPVVGKLNYTYFSQLNLVFTAVVMVVISSVTQRMSTNKTSPNLSGVTWWTRRDQAMCNDSSLANSTEISKSNSIETEIYTVNGKQPEVRTSESSCVSTATVDNNHDSDVMKIGARAQKESSADCRRRWLNVICGLPTDDAKDSAAGQQLQQTQKRSDESYRERMKLLIERTSVRRFLNLNAVVGVTIVAFLFGFFS